jgi:UDP-3-O-[3-hydroxymyristoyl] glucosamine N-acyltransferase
MKLTVSQLAERIGAELEGEGSAYITAVGPVAAAGADNVTFVTSNKHKVMLRKSGAGAVIVDNKIDSESLLIPQLVVKDVNVALIETLNIFTPELKAPVKGIAPTAVVAESAKIGDSVSVGPGVVIEDGVEIGENSLVSAGCKIGQNSKIGKNGRLDCNVVVYHNCIIGNNVIIQANSTIGSVGYGYYFIEGRHKLIPHNGSVVIEDFVEIGANCCIDRAKFGNTRIGAGTKIDNLVQIAHNVVIGKCCLIAGQVGIAGSAKLGDGVVLGGQSGIGDNIEVGDKVMVAAQSGIIDNIQAGQKLFGMPAVNKTKAFKMLVLSRRLPEMVKQLKQLNNRIKSLETAKDNKK